MAGNKNNLKVPTSEEARLNGRKGGLASVKARRERKDMQARMRELLDMPLTDAELEDIKSLKDCTKTKNITVAEAIMIAQIRRARAGDPKSFELVRDTAGYKSAEKQEIKAVVENSPLQGILEQLKDDDEDDEDDEKQAKKIMQKNDKDGD